MDFRSFMFFHMMQQAQDRLLNERFGNHDLHDLFEEETGRSYEDDDRGAGGQGGGARQPSDTPIVTGSKSKEAKKLGPHAWGSKKGRKLRQEADVHMKKGDEASQNMHIELSVGFYSEAIECAEQVCNNEEQVAALLCKRATGWITMKAFDLAFSDGSQSYLLRPQFYLGPWMMAQAFIGDGKYKEALAVGLEIVTDPNIHIPMDEQMKIFAECIKISQHVPGGMVKIAGLGVKPPMWKETLTHLCETDAWFSVSLLILGTDDHKGIVQPNLASHIKLSGLLKHCSPSDWKKWGQRLTVKLLQNGAQLKTLDADEKYPLHAAFEAGMRTGCYELLNHMFLRHIPAADRDRVDDEGNTLLHIACKGTYASKEKAIELLLNHQLDPLLKNKKGLLPVELLSNSDVGWTELLKVMETKGFDTSSIKKKKNTEKKKAGKATTKTPDKPTNKLEASLSIPPSSVDEKSSAIITGPQQLQTSTKQPIVNQSFNAYGWNKGQVKKWMDDSDLTYLRDSLPGLSGPDLVELRLIQDTAPEFFIKILKDELRFSFTQILKASSIVRGIE